MVPAPSGDRFTQERTTADEAFPRFGFLLRVIRLEGDLSLLLEPVAAGLLLFS